MNLPESVCRLPPRKKRAPRCGFALVTALLLMSFVLLLLVSITTLVQVEVRTSANTAAQLRARETAKLALYKAIGDLQKLAGPDARVTARAEIFGTSVSDGARYWTGIWNTETPDDEPRWLVSGSAPDPANPGSSLMQLVGPQSTNLTGNGHPGYPDQSVSAPAVEIRDDGGQPAARAAWWIGDEGVKASVGGLPLNSRENPNFLDDHEAAATELQLGNLQGIEELFPDYDRFAGNPVSRQKQIHFTGDMQLFELFSDGEGKLNFDDATESPFHSLTPSSLGVLANTLPASEPGSGLMRDLSLYPELLGDGLANYLAMGEAHEAILSGSGVNGLRLFTDMSGLDALPGLNHGDIAVPVTPVLTNFMIAFTIRSQSPAASNPNFYLRMRFFCEFWNPFTHSLRMEDSSGNGKELELEISGLPTVTVHKTTGTLASSPPVNIQTLLGDASKPGNPLVIRLDDPGAEDWLPGQTKHWTGVDASTATGSSPYRSIERKNKTWKDPDHNLGGSTGIDTGVSRLSADIRHSSGGGNEIGIRIYLKDTNSGDRTLLSKLEGFAYEPVSTRNDGYSNTHKGATFGYHIILRGPRQSSDDPEYFRGLWLHDHDPRNPSPNLNADWYLDNDPGFDTGSAYVPVIDAHAPLHLPLPQMLNETDNTIEISDFERLHDRSIGVGDSFNHLWQDTPLFELPRQRVLSIASLQHVYFHGERPFQVGNSWGSGGSTNTSAWFDRYYFSGFSRADDSAEYDRKAGPPNPALLDKGPITGDLLAAWQKKDADDAAAARAPGEKLMVANRFNINSTSVPAWKAVLGSLRLDGWHYLDYPETNTSDLTNLKVSKANRAATFARFSHSLSETYEAPETPASDGDEPVAPTAFYRHGARRLSESQIEELADEIVRGLQAQGQPFMNMEDFLSADSTGSSLLENAITSVLAPDDGRQDWYHEWEMAGDASAIGGSSIEIDHFSPGFLTQADILTAIGPMLSARSDTFKIRARGQALNLSGEVSGDAMLEAIVQRTPDPLSSTSGDTFGRKFKILALRWLDPPE